MKRCLLTILLVCAILMSLLTGCTKKLSTPDISQFSGTEYETHGEGQDKYSFLPVESATFLHDGKEEVIDPSDPRLIRLLNSLAYSYAMSYTSYLQGVVEEPELSTYTESDVPMLDITFSTANAPNRSDDFCMSYRAVISSNCYLLYLNPEKTFATADAPLAYQHWPYQEVLVSQYPKNSSEALAIINSAWGDNQWIDMLAYAGFST